MDVNVPWRADASSRPQSLAQPSPDRQFINAVCGANTRQHSAAAGDGLCFGALLKFDPRSGCFPRSPCFDDSVCRNASAAFLDVYRNASTAFLSVCQNASTAFFGARTLLLVLGLVPCGATAGFAQTDFSGTWAPIFHEDQVERIPGPDVGDYAGLPINDALRLKADTWDASLLTMPEHQCKPHPSIYGFRGVGNLRITAGFNEANQQLMKISTHIQWQEQRREIWMDGRPHPPEYAPHTWQGFSTGRFEGQRAGGADDALEGGVDSPQWSDPQR